MNISYKNTFHPTTTLSLPLTPLFPSRVKALYDYEAQDLDELTIKEGELIDLLKEGIFLKNLFTRL